MTGSWAVTGMASLRTIGDKSIPGRTPRSILQKLLLIARHITPIMDWPGGHRRDHASGCRYDRTRPCRNDCHLSLFSILDPDPLELATLKKETIDQYFPSTEIILLKIGHRIAYDNLTPPELMKALAKWTNENFLSKDTVPFPGQQKTANGQARFDSPNLDLFSISNGYFMGYVDGKRTIIARALEKALLSRIPYVTKTYTPTVLKTVWVNPEATGWLLPDQWKLLAPTGIRGTTKGDDYVMQSQLKLLIPTAVRASEAVIERFLPCFVVEAKVIPLEANDWRHWYRVKSYLEYQPTDEWKEKWPDGPVVHNGAYVVINGATPYCCQNSWRLGGFLV